VSDPLAGAIPEPPLAPLQPTAPVDDSLAGTAEAAGFGALQGLTAGGFGYIKGLARQMSPEEKAKYPATAELAEIKRQEEEQRLAAHPFAKGIGEFAGMVINPVGELGKAVTTGIKATTALGRVGAEVAGQAAVGSLFGAGNTLSDAALGDHELTAEKLIAGAGLGAVLGGGGGLLGSAITEGARAVLPDLAKSLEGAQGGLEEFANDRWLKASGGVQAEIKAIPNEERAAVADVLREHFQAPGEALPKGDVKEVLGTVAKESEKVGSDLLSQAGVGNAGGLLPGMDRDAAMEALGKGMEENGRAMGQVLKQADAQGAKFSYPDAVARFDQFEVGLNPAEREIISADLVKVRKYLGEMEQKGSGFEALNDIKSTIQKDTNWTADGAAKFGLKRQIAGILRDEIDLQLAPQVGSKVAKDFLDAKSAFGALANAEKALGRKAATGADAIRAIAEGAGLASPEAARFGALQHAERLLQRGVDRQLGNRFISLSDYLTGLGAGVARGDVAGVALGIGSAIGHKVLRERGSAIAATLADRIAASPALSAIATSFAQKLPQAIPQLGPYAAMLTQAATRGPQSALAAHMTLAATDPGYQQAAAMAGFLPESSEEHGAALVRAHGVAQVAATVQEHDKALDRAIASAIKGGKPPTSVKAVHAAQDFGSKRMRRDEEAAHAKRVEEVRNLANDPNALLERVTGNLGNLHAVAPGVAAALTARAHSAVQFLTEESREPPRAGPLAKSWAPTEHERWTFAQKLQAVEDPLSVLSHVGSGTVTTEQVRCLATVYPSLYRAACDRIIQAVADKPGIPYSTRIALSLFTGMDLDGTMNQAAIAANQATIQRDSVKPSNAGMPGSAKPKQGDLTLAQRTATPSQKREMGAEV